MIFCMDTAIIMLIACILAGAVSGALAVTWRLHTRLFRLEYRQDDLEAAILRETKKRAGSMGRTKKDEEMEFLARNLPAKNTETFDNEFPFAGR